MSAAESGPAQTTSAEQGTRDPAEIREEIEDTREELGETVAAVAEKTDVKKQAQAKKDELKERAVERASDVKARAQQNPVPLAIAGAFVAGLVLGRLLSR
jgi:ferric-dicitrate binding protein FerR (iron transport regulator)